MEVLNFPKVAPFKWTPERSQAAMLFAEGYTYEQIASETGKSRRTLFNWMGEPEFSSEVDRLSLMVGIASKAERLRLVKRIIRQKSPDGELATDKDVLDWLKFAQSETDGIKLDIASLLTAVADDAAPMARSRRAGSGSKSNTN